MIPQYIGARSWGLKLAAVLAVLSFCHECIAQSEYTPDWTRNFRIGAVTGFNIEGSLRLDGQFSVSGNDPGPTGVSGVDHVYDDGYVRVDQTGNAQGYTSFWGYESSSQYDAGSERLLMHSSTGFSGQGGGTEKSDFAIGAELAYGGTIQRWGRSRLGWEFGFAWLPFRVNDDSPISATVDRNTYAFDTGGILVPTAPFNGGSSGVGPTIRDVATLVGSDVVPGTILGTRSLDATLYAFRLGPNYFWDVSPSVGISVSAGPAFALVSQTYDYNESITFTDGSTASNSGSFDDTEMVYGGYINVTATYHSEDGADLYLGIQYTPLSSTSFSESGREGSVDFTGQVFISAGISWPF